MEHDPSYDTTSLKKLRIARSLSQSEVAEAIGTNANTISRWERGIATPSPYYRRKLAEYFGVDPQALFSDFNAEKIIIPETIIYPSEQDIEAEHSTSVSDKPQTTPSLPLVSGDVPEISPSKPEIVGGPHDPSRLSFKNKTLRWVYTALAGILTVVLVLVGTFVYASHQSKPPTTLFPSTCTGNFQSTNTPATNSIIPTSATSTSADGEPIGLSEGATIFDLNRPNLQEVQDKLQAAQDWVNNPQGVVSSLENAISSDPTDAEAQIYLENWKVLGSNHPHITFIVGVSFSSTANEGSLADYNGTSRDALQGAFTAQKECNDQYTQDNSQTQIVLMIANIGANVYGNNSDEKAMSVANQIAYQEVKDPTIVGIIGWLFSADSVNMNHQLKASGNQLPMVSPTSATDDLGNMFQFFRICNANRVLAKTAADFTLKNKKKKRIAILYAPGNTYANTLEADFYSDIKNNTAGPAVPFTGGQLDTLQSALKTVLAQNPDAIFFSGYEGDLFQLLIDPSYLTFAHARNPLIVSAPELDATSDYPPSFPDMRNVYFPSTGSPHEWDNVTPQPQFFQEYKRNFGTLTAPNGLPSIDADDMSSYDAVLTLLYASQQALSKHNNTITPSYLENELKQITVANPIQGITGRIAFDSNGDQAPGKMIFMEHIDGNRLVIDESHGCQQVTDNCSS